ncbi:MAG: cyclase family protein [Spirochaetaceae bacterium]|jgi:arylformamidase|nr:cyclase family protein [Spirochaetaceae bacterium]
MELIDISQALEPGMVKYQSLNDFSVEWQRHYSLGSRMALSTISMPSHLGTHIDAPFHFIEGGKKTDGIGLEKLCGEAQLIDGRGEASLDRSFFEALAIRAPRILIKTDNTEKLKTGADFDNVYITAAACECLADRGVVLVGFDFFNLDKRGDKSRAAHLALLSREVVILEGLMLDSVLPGNYELFCLPLKVKDLEGAPCRAVLRRVN